MPKLFRSGPNPVSILHSKRTGIYYLEHCRILMRDDRVDYALDRENGSSFWNLPTGNTIVLLLGNGTSITQAAARRLSEDGVMLAFVGGGGTPLFMASQSEYRPTEYCQAWISRWSDEPQRLVMCREMSGLRCDFVARAWARLQCLKSREEAVPAFSPDAAINAFRTVLRSAKSTSEIMNAEARCAKSLYATLGKAFQLGDFTREHGKKSTQDDADIANSLLDHGNYLAYGLAATALWVLGIPHSLPVSHGLTRRGALVFDVADLIKDGIVMPLAFSCAARGVDDQQFRHECLREFYRFKVMDFMINGIKAIALDQCDGIAMKQGESDDAELDGEEGP